MVNAVMAVKGQLTTTLAMITLQMRYFWGCSRRPAARPGVLSYQAEKASLRPRLPGRVRNLVCQGPSRTGLGHICSIMSSKRLSYVSLKKETSNFVK